MKLEEIHKSGILSDIQRVMMEDIKSSIMIVNERLGAPCTPELDSTGDIYLRSFVDGHQGVHRFIRVQVVLTKSTDYYYPILQIVQFVDDKEISQDISLRSIRLIEVYHLKKSNVFKRKKLIHDYVIQETQSERITILEEVTDLFEREIKEYRVGGVYDRIQSAMRLI